MGKERIERGCFWSGRLTLAHGFRGIIHHSTVCMMEQSSPGHSGQEADAGNVGAEWLSPFSLLFHLDS
jgi:hypothetical protein